MSPTKLSALILSIVAVLLGSSSVVHKRFFEEHVFYDEAYEPSIKVRDIATNSIAVINKAWWASEKNILLQFTVNAESDKIYLQFIGKKTSDLKTLDNSKFNPDVAVLTDTAGVTLDKVSHGDGTCTIHVNCKDLPAKTTFLVTVLWLSGNCNDLGTTLEVDKKKDCKSIHNAPWFVKYHLIPLLLFALACACAGLAIGAYSWSPEPFDAQKAYGELDAKMNMIATELGIEDPKKSS